MSHDDKVIHAFTPLPENPIHLERRQRDTVYCGHDQNISLDEHDRLVRCMRCGATLDPFQYLVDAAKTLAMAWRHHATVTERYREINERVELLRKEEKRLRSRVKRLQENAE